MCGDKSMTKLAVGDQGKFRTSCGQEIIGQVVEVTKDGYTVSGCGAKSNLHEDGLFRFTFT
jgi:hypothetical protein